MLLNNRMSRIETFIDNYKDIKKKNVTSYFICTLVLFSALRKQYKCFINLKNSIPAHLLKTQVKQMPEKAPSESLIV